MPVLRRKTARPRGRLVRVLRTDISAQGTAGVRRPSVIGHYTNDLVYNRLAPGVLDELNRINPTISPGRRKDKHHQWFTPDSGLAKLNLHIAGVMALMRASPNWNAFKRSLQHSYPKQNEQMPLALGDDE